MERASFRQEPIRHIHVMYLTAFTVILSRQYILAPGSLSVIYPVLGLETGSGDGPDSAP